MREVHYYTDTTHLNHCVYMQTCYVSTEYLQISKIQKLSWAHTLSSDMIVVS